MRQRHRWMSESPHMLRPFWTRTASEYELNSTCRPQLLQPLCSFGSSTIVNGFAIEVAYAWQSASSTLNIMRSSHVPELINSINGGDGGGFGEGGSGTGGGAGGAGGVGGGGLGGGHIGCGG